MFQIVLRAREMRMCFDDGVCVWLVCPGAFWQLCVQNAQGLKPADVAARAGKPKLAAFLRAFEGRWPSLSEAVNAEAAGVVVFLLQCRRSGVKGESHPCLWR